MFVHHHKDKEALSNANRWRTVGTTSLHSTFVDPRQALALRVDHYIWWLCSSVRACVRNASKLQEGGI